MPKALLHGFANKDNAVPEGQDGFGGWSGRKQTVDFNKRCYEETESAYWVLQSVFENDLFMHFFFFQLAPENTEMSFQKTVEHGADGLETDVTIR